MVRMQELIAGIAQLTPRTGVCSYLVGQMWEMTGGGESIIVSGEGDELAKAPESGESILLHEVELVF